MLCTLKVITALLGYQPQPGQVVLVPHSVARLYSEAKQNKAKRCASRYGFTLRIDDK